jgi:hypothetical protein
MAMLNSPVCMFCACCQESSYPQVVSSGMYLDLVLFATC